MAKWRSTTFTEIPFDSPRESFGMDASQSTRVLDVDWGVDCQPSASSRQQAVIDFLGYSVIGTNTAGYKYISRIIPHPHPDWLFPSDPSPLFLWAEKADIEGRGAPILTGILSGNLKSSNSTFIANLARLTIVYTSRPYEILPDTPSAVPGWVTENMTPMPTYNPGGGDLVPDESSLARYVVKKIQPSAQYLNIPGGKFQLVMSPASIPAPGTPGQLVPEYDVTLTWHQVPQAAVGTRVYNPSLIDPPIDHGLGKLNLNTIWGFKAGTLLMEPPEIEPHISPFGLRVFNVTYHFKWFPYGHNWLYYVNPTGSQAGYYEATTTGKPQVPVAGYSAPPTVTFSAPGGAGVTATGTAVLTGNVVTSVTIINAGTGYTNPPLVSFSPAGAIATATIAGGSVTAVNILNGYGTDPNHIYGYYDFTKLFRVPS